MCTLPLLTFVLALQTAAPAATTAIVRGRITEADTGAPIPRALVVLIAPTGGTNAVRADENGLYEFRDVAPNSYRVMAQAAPFRATHLPGDYSDASQSPRAAQITLKAGDVRTRIDIALRRSMAISGRVLDEWGLPVAGTTVIVGSAFMTAARTGWAETDDRGHFRVFGLTRGRYFVCTGRGPAPGPRIIGPPSRARSVPTCYPSAIRPADATRVVVADTDVDGMDIRIVRGKAFSVSGAVVDAQGAAVPRASITLEEWSASGSGSSSRSVEPDGHFTFPNLLPREYILSATRGPATDGGETGHVRIGVVDRDLEAVVVALSPTIGVKGRLTFENGAAPRADGGGFMIGADTADTIDLVDRRRWVTAKPDMTFDLRIDGPSAISLANVPTGWVVQSVRYKGQEIIDTLTTFADSGEATTLEILLTERGGTLSGVVRDGSEGPASEAAVILFPADSALWRSAPRSRPVWASSTGRFRMESRRAGEYFAAAINRDEIPTSLSAEFFARLSKVATRVVLGEGERRTIDLPVVKIPEDR